MILVVEEEEKSIAEPHVLESLVFTGTTETGASLGQGGAQSESSRHKEYFCSFGISHRVPDKPHEPRTCGGLARGGVLDLGVLYSLGPGKAGKVQECEGPVACFLRATHVCPSGRSR